MAEKTNISWTDHTWNPWYGCTEVSPACDHCYARVMMDERYHKVTWGSGNDRIRTSASTWYGPIKWDRAAAAAGVTRTVFCLSLGDIWDNEIDPMWRRAAFDVMERTPNLLYLLLSKRIGNAPKMCDPFYGNPLLPSNCALGATMINQEEWDRDLPKLEMARLYLGARFTFASVEPMLGPIDAHGHLPDWVIVGGESGTQARPMLREWATSLRDQCSTAGVRFHFKQWGEWTPGENVERKRRTVATATRFNDRWIFGTENLANYECHVDDEPDLYRIGKNAAGRRLDGVEHNDLAPLR